MKNIATALISAQEDLKNPDQNKQGYGYKYADLASILDQVKPVLAKHKLAITQLACDDGNGRVGVETILMHESGETFTSKLTLPIPDMKGNTATQQAGAAITYARRYAISAILNITSDEDTDAKGDAANTAPKKNNNSEVTTVVPVDQPEPGFCEQHNCEMPAKYSEKKSKWYWCHRNPDDGAYCFGKGYLDKAH